MREQRIPLVHLSSEYWILHAFLTFLKPQTVLLTALKSSDEWASKVAKRNSKVRRKLLPSPSIQSISYLVSEPPTLALSLLHLCIWSTMTCTIIHNFFPLESLYFWSNPLLLIHFSLHCSCEKILIFQTSTCWNVLRLSLGSLLPFIFPLTSKPTALNKVSVFLTFNVQF